MKYVSILIVAFHFMATPLLAQGDAISNYFDQYVDDEKFTMVYISPKMFSLISKLDIDDMDDEEAEIVMDMVSDLRGLRVLTTDHTPEKYYKEALEKINTSEYDILMSVRDRDENVQFLVKDEGDVIDELLLLVGGDDEFVLISFLGKIDLDKISELSKVIDINGTNHLEKLDDDDYKRKYKNKNKNKKKSKQKDY